MRISFATFQESTNRVVTGSTGGIGRAIAIALAKDGMNIVLHVRREDERSARLLEEVKATGAEVFVAAADIAVRLARRD